MIMNIAFRLYSNKRKGRAHRAGMVRRALVYRHVGYSAVESRLLVSHLANQNGSLIDAFTVETGRPTRLCILGLITT